MRPPLAVLNRYGSSLAQLEWRLAPAGLSGATVWRGEGESGPLVALKQWPPDYPPARLAEIHGWMSLAAHLPFIPSVVPANDGSTVVLDADRIWDATRWIPGSPSPREKLETADVEAACAAIAQLHVAWRGGAALQACPGIRNRLRLLRDWSQSPVSPTMGFTPDLVTLVRRATALVHEGVTRALGELEPWEHVSLPVQPCLRDLRAEHVLFAGNLVTGIVDFGAMAFDHPAVDLARYLGDIAGLTAHQFGRGLQSYRQSGSGCGVADEFVKQLARGGIIGSAIIWLRRLAGSSARNYPMNVMETRLSHLVGRLEDFALI